MIVAKLMGGMGNQMFIYAMALAQATRLNCGFLLDISHLGGKRPYRLDQWGLTEDTCLRDTPVTTLELSLRFNPNLSIKDGDCFQGYWQTEKYFGVVRDKLLQVFIPRAAEASRFLEFHDRIIHDENSVMMHVRHGDYLHNGTFQYHGVLDVDYYNRALEEISKTVTNPSPYIFSDDPEWVHKNFKHVNYQFVEARQDASNIFLMSRCRHAITANSSYSWWGAWLAPERSERIVIAPKNWFSNPTAQSEAEDIVPENWRRL